MCMCMHACLHMYICKYSYWWWSYFLDYRRENRRISHLNIPLKCCTEHLKNILNVSSKYRQKLCVTMDSCFTRNCVFILLLLWSVWFFWCKAYVTQTHVRNKEYVHLKRWKKLLHPRTYISNLKYLFQTAAFTYNVHSQVSNTWNILLTFT